MKRRILLSLAALVTFVLSGLQSNAQQNICFGDTVCLTVQARGTVVWQHSTNQTTWTNIPGATGDTACVVISTTGWVRAEITEGTCDPIYSDTTHFNVIGGPGGSMVFNYTGAVDTFLVPSCIDSIHVVMEGAQGATAPSNGTCIIGGMGGRAEGDLIVTGGDTLFIYVGGQGMPGNAGGWNGAGVACNNTSTCATGGGASDIRVNGNTLNDRRIVAGGGGGAEYSGCVGTGGAGGGLTGGTGTSTSGGGTYNGTGGTQSAGGTGGAGASGYGGTNGAFGVGGNSGTHPNGHAGSGGGGWYGGGGGGADGHAGGGSSYIGGVNNGTTTPGTRSGHGIITISW